MRLLPALLVAITLFADEAPATLAQLRAQAHALKIKGDAAGALAACREAIALAPNSAELHDEAGFLLAVLNRRQEAISYFAKAIG